MDKLRRLAELVHHAQSTIRQRVQNIDARLSDIETDLQAITTAISDINTAEGQLEAMVKEEAAKAMERN